MFSWNMHGNYLKKKRRRPSEISGISSINVLTRYESFDCSLEIDMIFYANCDVLNIEIWKKYVLVS